jgi:hypothetical protein
MLRWFSKLDHRENCRYFAILVEIDRMLREHEEPTDVEIMEGFKPELLPLAIKVRLQRSRAPLIDCAQRERDREATR